MKADEIHFPRPSDEGRMTSFEWMPIRYRNVISVLKNPFYAGVYVYGKSEKRTEIIEGRARKSYGHGKPIGTWDVMIKDHHQGYISWAEYERNQKHLWPSRRPQVRSWRQGVVVGHADLRPMRTSAGGCLYGQSSKPSGVSLRQAEPYDGPAKMHDLWRAAGRRRDRQGAAQGS